ncbi:MAG: hypothetical protein KA275_09515 [Chitinophagaceae bacterium]|nr:hypothetical protein [Chitinophagaceae bacterium]
MEISNRNYNRIERLYFFCWLYTAHRDFDLAKRIAKNNPLNWKQAESLSDFCNQIALTNETKPQEFISEENESTDNAIDKYLVLKECIEQVKLRLGAKGKNELYKSVKFFYRKKSYCYQMDSYYTFLINGLFMYVNRMITFQEFLKNYCFEVSLFTGKKTPINLKYVIKMSNHILKC